MVLTTASYQRILIQIPFDGTGPDSDFLYPNTPSSFLSEIHLINPHRYFMQCYFHVLFFVCFFACYFQILGKVVTCNRNVPSVHILFCICSGKSSNSLFLIFICRSSPSCSILVLHIPLAGQSF